MACTLGSLGVTTVPFWVSSFAWLHSTPSSTVRASCKALLGCGDSLKFPVGRPLLLAGSDSPEANWYLAGKRCCYVFRCNCYLTNPCETRPAQPECMLAHAWGLALSAKGLQVGGAGFGLEQ